MFNLNCFVVILFTSIFFVICAPQNETVTDVTNSTLSTTIVVTKGSGFWINCTFDFDTVVKPWILTVKKVGNWPLEIYQVNSANETKIGNISVTNVDVSMSRASSIRIREANEKTFGVYDCELLDGGSAARSMNITIEEGNVLQVEQATSGSMSWLNQSLQSNFIMLILFFQSVAFLLF